VTIELTYLVVVAFPRYGKTVTGRYVTTAATADKAAVKVKAALAKSFKLKKTSIALEGVYRPTAGTEADAIPIP
jgi:hypothetical protein